MRHKTQLDWLMDDVKNDLIREIQSGRYDDNYANFDAWLEAVVPAPTIGSLGRARLADLRTAWRRKKRNAGPKRSAQKRISAALTKFLKKQNPAMRRATHVRVKKLKGGGITILPA